MPPDGGDKRPAPGTITGGAALASIRQDWRAGESAKRHLPGWRRFGELQLCHLSPLGARLWRTEPPERPMNDFCRCHVQHRRGHVGDPTHAAARRVLSCRPGARRTGEPVGGRENAKAAPQLRGRPCRALLSSVAAVVRSGDVVPAEPGAELTPGPEAAGVVARVEPQLACAVPGDYVVAAGAVEVARGGH